MKIIYLILFSSIVVQISLAQHYKQDLRTDSEKQDRYNVYQADLVNKIDLLKALDWAGIRCFKFPLRPFDKEYKLEILLSEFVDGKKISENNIFFYGKNTYNHFEGENYFVDYINDIAFYSKEKNDSTISLSVQTLAASMGDVHLKKRILRDGQFYNWRTYSKTEWEIGKEIPLAVWASSWYDERFKFDRFCGVVDMSSDTESAQELLGSSPHYYLLSYRVM